MSYGYIYKITFPNGKCYIGLTNRTIEQRWKEHNKDAKAGNMRCLFASLRKYNMVDTFQMIEIDTAETEQELCEKEIAHIEIHNSHYIRGYGYNMTDGGDGVFGYSHTDETKERLRTLSLKQFESTEARQKMSEIKKKYYKDNPEARQKISEVQKKYHKDNPEAGQKHSEVMKKRYEDPNSRQILSEAQKKRYEDPEERRKNSEARKKYYKDNPEARQKISEARKKYYKDNPEAGKAHGEYMKKYYKNNQEARRRQSKYEPFDVFKIDGTYIKSFNYQFEATEYLQTNYEIKTRIKISDVLKGTRKSSHGFTFKYI